MGSGGGGAIDAAAPGGRFQEAGKKAQPKEYFKFKKSGFCNQQFLNYCEK
jgi:hypothetical protein